MPRYSLKYLLSNFIPNYTKPHVYRFIYINTAT